MEILQRPSVEEKKEMMVTHCIAAQEDWRTSILKYLFNQELLDFSSEAK